MGAEGAVNILYRKQLKEMEDSGAARARLVAEFREKFAKPYRAAASGHIDDILIPAETRPRLIAALELLRDKRVASPSRKHGNIPL
jgi:propionyl-CoA carboxylase beta chain